MRRLVIIGGSDAGISAALQARDTDPSAAVSVLVADQFPNYSICGLPFYLSGEVPHWRSLAHRSATEIASQGIELLLDHTATAIDPARKSVMVRETTGQSHEVRYDQLVIATGATPLRPAMRGLDQPGVYVLHTMADSFALQDHLTEHAPRSAVIIGGGYIGVEMADALVKRGLAVTLLQRPASVLPAVDATLAAGITAELRRHGVTVSTGVAVESIACVDGRLVVAGIPDFQGIADLVLVATGVLPATSLAQAAGISVGERGAIQVTRAMETTVADIYAAGDCVETWHRLLGRPTYLPLGTTSHKQGRVAGENVAGGHRVFAGSVGTQVVKVFELAIAGTGLRDETARAAGFTPLTVELSVPDHKEYYPGAHALRIRVTGDCLTGRLLGGQILGHWQAGVAKRIDTFATALFHDMRVDEISDLDLSYTPPVSSPYDPVQMSAQAWVRACTTPPAQTNPAPAAAPTAAE